MQEMNPRESGLTPLSMAIAACKRQFIGAATFSAFSNLLYMAPTLYMLQVYDRVIPTGGVTTLILLSLVTLTALGLLGALDWLRSRLMVRASAGLDRQLAGPILDAVLRQPGLSAMSRMKAMREFDHLRQSLSGAGLLALFDLPWTPIYLILAFLMHPALALLGLVASALLFGLTFLNERATNAPLQAANEAASAAYATQDFASGSADVIRALGHAPGHGRQAFAGAGQNDEPADQGQLHGGRLCRPDQGASARAAVCRSWIGRLSGHQRPAFGRRGIRRLLPAHAHVGADRTGRGSMEVHYPRPGCL